jgi:hypothetical protein
MATCVVPVFDSPTTNAVLEAVPTAVAGNVGSFQVIVNVEAVVVAVVVVVVVDEGVVSVAQPIAAMTTSSSGM